MWKLIIIKFKKISFNYVQDLNGSKECITIDLQYKWLKYYSNHWWSDVKVWDCGM